MQSDPNYSNAARRSQCPPRCPRRQRRLCHPRSRLSKDQHKRTCVSEKKNSSEELNGGFVGFRWGRVSTTVSEYLLCMHSEIDFAKHPLA